MKLYTPYINNFNAAQKMLKKMQLQDPHFALWIEVHLSAILSAFINHLSIISLFFHFHNLNSCFCVFQETKAAHLNDLQRNDLSSLLVLPIQRIPRYILLLKVREAAPPRMIQYLEIGMTQLCSYFKKQIMNLIYSIIS